MGLEPIRVDRYSGAGAALTELARRLSRDEELTAGHVRDAAAIVRPAHDGHVPRSLHDNATMRSWAAILAAQTEESARGSRSVGTARTRASRTEAAGERSVRRRGARTPEGARAGQMRFRCFPTVTRCSRRRTGAYALCPLAVARGSVVLFPSPTPSSRTCRARRRPAAKCLSAWVWIDCGGLKSRDSAALREFLSET